MWTPATRGRMAEIEKKTKRYPTDLTDEKWARIEPFLPGAAKSGRPARTGWFFTCLVRWRMMRSP